MSILELLRWQWSGYPRYHHSRANLLIHIVVVPLFLAGNVALVVAVIERSATLAIFSVVAMVVSVAFQARGHGKEEVPPEPFTSRTNALSRILLEQWVTFPRFVISGGWFRALRQSSPP
ncbi:hypothetical protein DTO96_101172 [Ephemeroptericola cinctiostellae]|uniref:Terminase n=1 Tax=Ephemeroptericola cinctiostellae TaxID=2268024 RepID=A0A345DAQ3_9BURK|nr:Mpo1-like protein [Ephemeroptericola cinctiostellae]AXF85441.1 hypothetical protein DTO96_101172 [Ephemeroptericola cinctiostellae]